MQTVVSIEPARGGVIDRERTATAGPVRSEGARHAPGASQPVPEPDIERLRGARLLAVWVVLTLGAWALVAAVFWATWVGVLHLFG